MNQITPIYLNLELVEYQFIKIRLLKLPHHHLLKHDNNKWGGGLIKPCNEHKIYTLTMTMRFI